MNRGLVLGGCGGGLLVEFVGEVGVEAFHEMAVGVHGDDDGAVSESDWMALGWAPWAMRRAAWVCRRSWYRSGRPTEVSTAGCQNRYRHDDARTHEP